MLLRTLVVKYSIPLPLRDSLKYVSQIAIEPSSGYRSRPQSKDWLHSFSGVSPARLRIYGGLQQSVGTALAAIGFMERARAVACQLDRLSTP